MRSCTLAVVLASLLASSAANAGESGFSPPGNLLPRSEHLLTHFYSVIVERVTEKV